MIKENVVILDPEEKERSSQYGLDCLTALIFLGAFIQSILNWFYSQVEKAEARKYKKKTNLGNLIVNQNRVPTPLVVEQKRNETP